jgi:D-alanyl-D-alanine carboxypeptidase (penicillin-binding protein 5/6)
MKTVKNLLLFVILLLSSSLSYARNAAILVDASNGNILFEQEATQAWYPASLTKLMTIYMALDAINTGRIQLQDTISASYNAARQPQSKLGLHVGETITVEEAILALVTRSANDAAVALAEYIGGTEESFAVKMTEKAHELGMNDTHFMNATGLPHPWQVSTARDLGLLAWKTMHSFPDYYPYFSAHSFNFRGRELHAINKFTEHYLGAEGMKTGFTCGSGYNLISSASQNGQRLIGVILGGMSSPQRYQLMIDMMDAGFAGQYAGVARSIATPVALTGATPPHQLPCGRAGGLVTASTEDANDDHIVHRRGQGDSIVPTKFHPRGHVVGRRHVTHQPPAKASKATKASKGKAHHHR